MRGEEYAMANDEAVEAGKLSVVWKFVSPLFSKQNGVFVNTVDMEGG
jgi:hypothetical protein